MSGFLAEELKKSSKKLYKDYYYKKINKMQQTSKIPITKEQAISLIREYNSDIEDHIHYLESEAVMRELAKYLGEDVDYYGMLGLLHDIDWGITKSNPKDHITKAPEILRNAGFDEEFIQIVVSHTYGFDCSDSLNKSRTKKIEFALAASETITGLIHAYALVRDRTVSDMRVDGLKKKYENKSFAANVDRLIIKECENLKMSLEDFFKIAIDGVKSIKDVVGLR